MVIAALRSSKDHHNLSEQTQHSPGKVHPLLYDLFRRETPADYPHEIRLKIIRNELINEIIKKEVGKIQVKGNDDVTLVSTVARSLYSRQKCAMM